jgi:hypothetical protein
MRSRRLSDRVKIGPDTNNTGEDNLVMEFNDKGFKTTVFTILDDEETGQVHGVRVRLKPETATKLMDYLVEFLNKQGDK